MTQQVLIAKEARMETESRREGKKEKEKKNSEIRRPGMNRTVRVNQTKIRKRPKYGLFWAWCILNFFSRLPMDPVVSPINLGQNYLEHSLQIYISIYFSISCFIVFLPAAEPVKLHFSFV